jgi:hypothetical protein
LQFAVRDQFFQCRDDDRRRRQGLGRDELQRRGKLPQDDQRERHADTQTARTQCA